MVDSLTVFGRNLDMDFCILQPLFMCQFLLSSRLQTGVVRTNCVDCLDRTNVPAPEREAFGVKIEPAEGQIASTLNVLLDCT